MNARSSANAQSLPAGPRLLVDSLQFFIRYWRAFLGLVGLALLPFVLIAGSRISYGLLARYFGQQLGEAAAGSTVLAFLYWFFFALTLVGYAGVLLVSFPATYGQFMLIRGLPKIGVLTAYRQAFHSFWRYAALALIVGVAIFIGSALFLIPGIVAAVWLLPALMGMVFEDTGVVASLKESARLVRGMSWTVLLRLLFWIFVSFCVQVVLLLPDQLLGALPVPSGLQQLGTAVSFWATVVWQTIAIPLWLIYLAALYSALRRCKDDDEQARERVSIGVKVLISFGLGLVAVFLTASVWVWLQTNFF